MIFATQEKALVETVNLFSESLPDAGDARIPNIDNCRKVAFLG